MSSTRRVLPQLTRVRYFRCLMTSANIWDHRTLVGELRLRGVQASLEESREELMNKLTPFYNEDSELMSISEALVLSPDQHIASSDMLFAKHATTIEEADRLLEGASTPTLLSGALTEDWHALREWVPFETFEHLFAPYSMSLISNRLAVRGKESSKKKTLMPIGSLSKKFKNESLIGLCSDPGTLHNTLLEDVNVESSAFMRGHFLNPVLSVIGAPLGGLPFHRHEATWQALILGRKLWCFSPPEAPPRTAHTRTFLDMLLNDARVTVCVQNPGDVVHVPKGWWHATYSLPNDLEAHGSSNEGVCIGYGGSGETPGLHYYAAHGKLEELRRATQAEAEQSGQSVDQVLRSSLTRMGRSLLHTAAMQGQLGVVEWLLEKGMPVDAEDSHRTQPLYWAVDKRHLTCVHKLLEYGASPSATNSIGITPLECSMIHRDQRIISACNSHLLGTHAGE